MSPPNNSELTRSARIVQWMTTTTFAVNVLVYLCVGFFLFWLDFFGFEHAARFQMQDLVVQALADRQPKDSQVAVVLWDDKDLAALEVMKGKPFTWPLSYGLHAKALRKILGARPRSVFVDVLFKDERPDATFPALQSALLRYKKSRNARNQRIQVYLANERGCGKDGIRPDLLHVGEEANKLSLSTTPVPVPIRSRDSFDSVIREYPTFAYKRIADDTKLLWECTTAAVRMHLDAQQEYDLRDYRMPFVMRWGGCKADPQPAEPLRWVNVLLGQERRQRPGCLPFEVVHARDLFSREGAKEAQRKLEDRFIVYGTKLESAGDLVNSPVHDALVPGPMVHAMALADLERWGSGYMRRPLPFAPLQLNWNDPLLTLILKISDFPLLLIGALAFALASKWEHALSQRRIEARGEVDGWVLVTEISDWVLAVVIVLLPPFLVFSFLGFLFFQIWHVSPVYIAPHIFVWILVENVTRIRKVLGAV